MKDPGNRPVPPAGSAPGTATAAIRLRIADVVAELRGAGGGKAKTEPADD